MNAGSSASSRFSGRTPTTLAAPSAANRAEYTSITSGPSADAVGTTTIRAFGPPAASTNSCRTSRFFSLSSAPPMANRAPGPLVVTPTCCSDIAEE